MGWSEFPTWTLLPSFLALLIGSMSCAIHRAPLDYRLARRGGNLILIPPRVDNPHLTTRTIDMHSRYSTGTCRGAESSMAIERHNSTIRVTVTRDQLLATPPGWLNTWTATLERTGCLAPGEGLRLLDLIVHALPLPPDLAFRLTHPNDMQVGYIDLGPATRIKVTIPIILNNHAVDIPLLEDSTITRRSNGIEVELRTSAAFIGYETAWYEAHWNNARTGLTLIPLSSERHIKGNVERLTAPSINMFASLSQPALFRLLYKNSHNDELVGAVLLAGATHGELEAERAAVITALGCGRLASDKCVTLPRSVGISTYMAVTVNGSDVVLPIGATVSEAIASFGQLDPYHVLEHLTIYKPFFDTSVPVLFDHSHRDILTLPLVGGEKISWK